MKDCCYCLRPVAESEIGDEADEHAACVAEWERRYDARKCVICGERAAANNYTCDKCGECDPYRGYPGGGS